MLPLRPHLTGDHGCHSCLQWSGGRWRRALGSVRVLLVSVGAGANISSWKSHFFLLNITIIIIIDSRSSSIASHSNTKFQNGFCTYNPGYVAVAAAASKHHRALCTLYPTCVRYSFSRFGSYCHQSYMQQQPTKSSSAH